MSTRHRKRKNRYPQWYVTLRKIAQWLTAQCLFGLLAFMRLFPADASINTIEKLGVFFGMRYKRTEKARENIKMALPEKTDEEVEEILKEMWASLSRTAAEYAYLDQIFDFDDNNPTQGRFEIGGIDNFAELKDLKGPAVCFTAHMANWELLPIGSAAYGVNITALFRPPDNPYIAKRVLSARRTAMGHLVPSKAGAAWALGDILAEGGKVGVLVDQYYRSGVPITFFGKPTSGNQLLAKLVRQYDCPVYPARCIRLPGGRFKMEVQKKLDIPRTSTGKVDINALTQSVNDVVEEWIREYPGQWLWLHNRWRRPPRPNKGKRRLARRINAAKAENS